MMEKNCVGLSAYFLEFEIPNLISKSFWDLRDHNNWRIHIVEMMRMLQDP